MLKKQTVWLLTLLSLTIVLSVFYMNSPDSDDFSFVFQEEPNDDLFTLIRMELRQSRSSQIEKLETVVASGTTSTDEKNTAFEEMQKIDQLSTKELIVEESLKEEYGYPDVLVRTVDDSIVVTIKTDQLSDKEANQIMRTVYDEFGSMQVEVKFQPSNS